MGEGKGDARQDYDAAAIERLLYGTDPTPRIVAVEAAGSGGMRVYRREADGDVTSTVEPFTPWLLLDPRAGLAAPPRAVPNRAPRRRRALLLAGHLPQLVRIHGRARTAGRGRDRLGGVSRPGRAVPGVQRADPSSRGWTTPTSSGCNSISRLPASTPPRRTPASCWSRSAARAATRRRSARTARTRRRSWRGLNEAIAAIDPDIIEGHNIYNFDLPYLRARAGALRIALGWGRDGSPLATGSDQRFKVMARSLPFVPHYVYGRHFLDTYQQIQRYDSAGDDDELRAERGDRRPRACPARIGRSCAARRSPPPSRPIASGSSPTPSTTSATWRR